MTPQEYKRWISTGIPPWQVDPSLPPPPGIGQQQPFERGVARSTPTPTEDIIGGPEFAAPGWRTLHSPVNVPPNENMLPDYPDNYRSENIAPNEEVNPDYRDNYRYENIAPNEEMLPPSLDTYRQPEFQNVPVNDSVSPGYPDRYLPPAPVPQFTTGDLPPDFWGSGGAPAPTSTPYPVQAFNPSDVFSAPFQNPAPGEDVNPPQTQNYLPPDYQNPAPNDVAQAPQTETYLPGNPSNPAPNEEVIPPPIDTYYLPHDNGYHVVTNGQIAGSIPATPAPEPGTGLPETTNNTDLGGWGQPMGFFGVPGQQPIGSMGLPMNWFSDLPGIYSGPLPGANIPSYFGNSGLTLGSGGGRTGQGIYGWASGSGGGAGGGGKGVPTGVQ